MGKIINLSLLQHPANWLIIFLVLYLGALLTKTVYTAAETGWTPFPLPASDKG